MTNAIIESQDNYLSTITCSEDAIEVENDTIKSCLSVYDLEHIYIKSARYSTKSGLTATFKSFKYPFSKKVKHFTREQAVAFMTQAAYVLAGQLVHTGVLSPLDMERYQRLNEEEKTTLTRVEIKFKRQIANTDGIKITIRNVKCKKILGKIFLRFIFSFQDGSCFGESDALITLEE